MKKQLTFPKLVFPLLILSSLLALNTANAQDSDERMNILEKDYRQQIAANKYKPQISGILRGKYEYEPELGAGRFEVRNARLSVGGSMSLQSAYKLEVDLCDESAIKMKDAWVRINPYRTLRISLGQQRMPFSIDAHRNPSAQFFANRSFIAKQVGDMRDVGFQIGYDFNNDGGRTVLSMDAGIFNGSNLDNQKSAWFKSPAYSARLQVFPTKGLALIPSVQHQLIAERKASYTSVDLGSFFKTETLHIEAEFLHKTYSENLFSDCDAIDAMFIYKQSLRRDKGLIGSISYLVRYDWMQDHSSGKSGLATIAGSNQPARLVLTDAERHRMTLGTTFTLRNTSFPTDIRFNYEKYLYPHGGAKESEQDKLVCEVVVKF